VREKTIIIIHDNIMTILERVPILLHEPSGSISHHPHIALGKMMVMMIARHHGLQSATMQARPGPGLKSSSRITISEPAVRATRQQRGAGSVLKSAHQPGAKHTKRAMGMSCDEAGVTLKAPIIITISAPQLNNNNNNIRSTKPPVRIAWVKRATIERSEPVTNLPPHLGKINSQTASLWRKMRLVWPQEVHGPPVPCRRRWATDFGLVSVCPNLLTDGAYPVSGPDMGLVHGLCY
jgi:hypothetical protein